MRSAAMEKYSLAIRDEAEQVRRRINDNFSQTRTFEDFYKFLKGISRAAVFDSEISVRDQGLLIRYRGYIHHLKLDAMKKEK